MASISKIGTSLRENLLYKPANWIGNTNFVKKTLGRKYQLNDDNIITAVGVGSVVAKDGIGCALYTYQSLHNESIPEDKRPFVAALDLTNGILMISTQIAMTIGFTKFQNKLFAKTLGKYFNRSAAKGYKSVLSKTTQFKGIGGDEFHPAFEKYKGTVTSAFTQITGLALSTIVAKRMIVPFLSTPLADTAKKWMMNKDEKNVVSPETKNDFDTEKKLDVSTADIKELPKNEQTKTQIPHSNKLIEGYVQSHPQK